MINNGIIFEKENEPLILPDATLRLIYKQIEPAPLIALYVFYYYTAKQPLSGQHDCSAGNIEKLMGLSQELILKANKRLAKLGLITMIQLFDDVTGESAGVNTQINLIWE
jgi:hypothetical protein